MDVLHNQVFATSNLSELFIAWSRFPDSCVYAGGTEIVRGQGGLTLHLPQNILSLSRIDELHRVSRTERYLEIGAMVSLSEVLALGKIVPEALRAAIVEIANPQIRNLATLGGNLCSSSHRMDTFAPLVALDARLELRNATTSRWVAAPRFAPNPGASILSDQELLTRVRIPLGDWDYTVHRRLGQAHWNDENSAVFTFIARAQKGILSEVHLAFAGTALLRDREIDTALVGKSLPLGLKEAAFYTERWRNHIQDKEYPKGLIRDRFLNLVEHSISGLTL